MKVGDDFSLGREISVGNYTVSNSSGTLFTADSYGEYHFSWRKTSGSGTQMYCNILQNGVTLQSTLVSDNYIANTIGNSGDIFTYSRGNGTRSITVTKTPILHKKNVGLLPNLIKGIGELVIGTLYGMHKDNVFYGGIITGTTETVETGNITLGNAVGFLEINYNGQMVKVPYYK